MYLELPSSSQWIGSESDEVERFMNIFVNLIAVFQDFPLHTVEYHKINP